MRGVQNASNPVPTRPYSPAIIVGEWIHLSGHVPVDQGGATSGSNGSEQAARVLKNLENTLQSAGASLADVVSTTVYLTDISLIDDIDTAYRAVFQGRPYPARTTVEVAALGRSDFFVEISAIAHLPAAQDAK